MLPLEDWHIISAHSTNSKDLPKTELLRQGSAYLVTSYQGNAVSAKVGFETGLDVKGIAPLNSPRQPKTSVFLLYEVRHEETTRNTIDIVRWACMG